MMSNITRYPQCYMRTALGNCDPMGGFCTSVNESVCEALHKVSRPQGEWELSAFQNEEEVANGNYTFICSNCEHSDIHALTQTVPYCWWCGARMIAKDINVLSKKGADDEA